MVIILDAHLLLLLIVGMTSRTYIGMHRRLQDYADDDFTLLTRLLSLASKIVVTPNILTETSNLAGYIAEPARTRIYETFRALVASDCTEEQYAQSKLTVTASEFTRIGLTDVGMMHIATPSHTLLTADLDLYLAALKRGLKAENFNHHRNFP
jgi:hypothetical protein